MNQPLGRQAKHGRTTQAWLHAARHAGAFHSRELGDALVVPWMRAHERLGAAVPKPEPMSLRITGTTAECESRTGMIFAGGDYWFPGRLATVHIDREHDRGSYWEPNVLPRAGRTRRAAAAH